MVDKHRHAKNLLCWYDRNARVLPWRVAPNSGRRADPYHVWLSEIMLQQTVVKTVIPYFETFLRNWPTVFDLAACDQEEILQRWAGLGYYARARNLHLCAGVVVQDHGGQFPGDEKQLLALPGIGPYTAAAILAIAFDQRASVVDGNVERVIARLYALKKPLRDIKPLIRKKAEALTPDKRPGDYAQAMMDLGAMICTPKNPACEHCPVSEHCEALQQDCAAALPVRAAKKSKPVRRGTAYLVVREDGAVLLRQRPEKGLLAKMLEVPSTGWIDEKGGVPVQANWHRLPGQVTHTFTHFHLQLDVHLARVEGEPVWQESVDQERCRWVPRHELKAQALPGVMRKIIAHGLEEVL